MQRIHITGGPGAGKSTLATELAARFGLPLFELDGQALRHLGANAKPSDFDAFALAREAEARQFAAGDAWISEGSNVAVARPLMARADTIVVLYCPWSTAAYRIVMRHIKAEVARNNRFPGWRRLYRFWRWCRRYYLDSNPDGLNEWGTPNTQSTLEAELEPYEHKLVRCHSKSDIEAFIASRLESSAAG